MNIKKVTPRFTQVITTMNHYEEQVEDENGIIDTTKGNGEIKEHQTVIAVGSSVREIKEGDVVFINPTRYGKKKHREGSLKDGVITDNPIVEYNFNTIILNGTPCLILDDRDIEFILDDFEE